ncbi:MAG: glycerol-3-phosphate dehydrogenase [Alphaproteobacteria bacterium]|nr:glycerol-3-phosphate dehydrogenase [Alphaproteobacteria bacterium]MCB1550925.1 glycerol-3-phosphate dehydrogenase [Alphaproteobacteria bacterium]MCB9984348.1 glycerol-3-phosphate dehydrogenase [Micavibrio sp.]
MADSHYDLCIVGGGINGAGIARDAAGRGFKVLLVDQGDFAGCTSSASSKMIHGGLRYLEFFDFGLVRKSLAEREIMMAIAPEIVHPLEFCIPHQNSVRPAWMVRLGLFIYDHLWPRKKLPSSQKINLKKHPYGLPLREDLDVGFTYADCWVDDARLVILNIRDAANHGADVRNYTKAIAVKRGDSKWNITVEEVDTGSKQKVTAKVVINATGPYAYEFLEKTGHVLNDTPKLRLVQGTHIVVPKLYEGQQAYLLQQPDKRVVFVFPYGKYSLCGTTETEFNGDPVEVMATRAEKKYLCESLNAHFKKQTSLDEIVWDYSGVRPLFEDSETDARKVSRDYRIYEDRAGGLTLLSIFGGKITTYRTLSEEVMDVLSLEFPDMKRAWTKNVPLPTCPVNLEEEPKDQDLKFFIGQEWAKTPEDVLWRRTKWGVHLPKDKVKAIEKRIPELIKKETTGNAPT